MSDFICILHDSAACNECVKNMRELESQLSQVQGELEKANHWQLDCMKEFELRKQTMALNDALKAENEKFRAALEKIVCIPLHGRDAQSDSNCLRYIADEALQPRSGE